MNEKDDFLIRLMKIIEETINSLTNLLKDIKEAVNKRSVK